MVLQHFIISMHSVDWLNTNELHTKPDCPLQTLGESLDANGNFVGKPIHQTVEEYADHLDVWLDDFVNAWEKMSQNGNSGLVDGPTNILTSRCCIHSSVKYIWDKAVEMKRRPGEPNKVDDALQCQALCKERESEGCKWFNYVTDGNHCRLLTEKPSGSNQHHDNKNLGGPPSCPVGEDSCQAYGSI